MPSANCSSLYPCPYLAAIPPTECPCNVSISSRGIAAALLTDDKEHRPEPMTIQFLSFTDYDGFGYSIAETFATQARYCLKNIAKKTGVEWLADYPVETLRLD